MGEASDAELQDAVYGPVPDGADSNNKGGVISNEGFDSEYTFDDIAAEPDRRGYFERIGSELKGSVMVEQTLGERLGNAAAAAYYGDPNTNTDGIESSVLFAKGFGEQLSDGWQELMADPFSIIRDPLTLAYDQIETAFYYGTDGFLGDPNSVARNQERGESLINLADAVEVGASDSEKAGYLFGGAILGLKKGKLPGPNKLNQKHLDLVTSHPDAHSIARHGGAVTDSQLQRRALTGVAPDGHVKVKPNGQVVLPSMSSAFYSDELLVAANQSVRNSAAFQRKVAELPPGETFITVKAGDVGDLGMDLGRGYKRIAGSRYKPELQGPPVKVENLRSVQATYELNSQTNVWETITIFPAEL